MKKKKSSAVMLVTDQDYLSVVLTLLDQAKKQVDIMAFSFAMASAAGFIDQKGAPFKIAEKLRELKEKHGAKIKIRLYVEGRRDTSERNRVTAEMLKEFGVVVKYGATHAKGFCVDGRYVLFGSTNLTNQSIMKNNETNLLFDEKSIALEFTRYFEHLWRGGKHGKIDLKAPMLADGAFKDVLLGMINTAKKDLHFSIYFFDHPEIREALLAAHQRKVKITGFVHQHQSFALSYVRRTKKTISLLKSGGLKNLYFAGGNLFTHSKYLVKDHKELALGTGNWLREDVEIHPQLYVHLEDPKLCKQLTKHLDGQIREQGSKA